MTESENLDIKSTSPKRRYWSLIIFLSLVVLFVIIGVRLFQNNRTSLEIGQVPEGFILDTYTGGVIETTELKGHVVLVNFWASWCDPCEEEALLLEEAWQQIEQEEAGKVVFLGVAYNDAEPASRAFLEEYEISYSNGPDLRGEISKIFDVNGVPETYILDQQGRLQYIKYGPFFSKDEIISAIQQVRENSEEN